MNIELLEKVKEKILEEPNLLDMGVWSCRPSLYSCKTAHCIGGWAIAIGDPDFNLDGEASWSIMQRATQILDVFQSGRLGSRLFYTDEWPIGFMRQYEEATHANDYVLMAKIAVDVIDSFIETNGWAT